ncbi:MAG TPA: hypothetical protein VMB51_04080 [Solirubrobacteraceae bacterium]|nr:hypothetical protein [Solirubrobacteraceae bacterium]
MREEISTWLALGELARRVDVALAFRTVDKDDVDWEEFARELADSAASVGIDRARFAGLLKDDLESASNAIGGERPLKFSALQSVRDRQLEVRAALAERPPSTEKAELFLQVMAESPLLECSEVEAYAEQSVDLSNNQRKALAEEWRGEWQQRRQKLGDQIVFTRGQAFWVSRDFHEHYDDIAYYRVYDRYGLGEFDELFDDVAKGIGEVLIEQTAMGDPFGRYQLRADALAVAELLWLVSRSRRLRLVLHTAAAGTLTALYHAQHSDGWWPAPVSGEGGEHPPSAAATAMAVIAGRRMSRDEHHAQQAEKAVRWLIGAQGPDGSWRDFRSTPHVLATAVSLDAIASSGLPNVDTVCERAAQWLLDQQNEVGLWVGDVPEILMTVAALEAIRSVSHAGRAVPAGLAGGLALVGRAQLLAQERSVDARQLAVVAAYTGLESVLYALLAHPTISVSTTRSGSGQTIGFDEALLAYETALVELGHLDAGKHVGGHHRLRGLTSVRDGVVHHGQQPSTAETKEIVQAALRFCREQIPLVMGIDPLED